MSDTSKNQPKRLDSDNQINVSRLIVILEKASTHVRGTALRKNPREKVSQTQALDPYSVSTRCKMQSCMSSVDEARRLQGALRAVELFVKQLLE